MPRRAHNLDREQHCADGPDSDLESRLFTVEFLPFQMLKPALTAQLTVSVLRELQSVIRAPE
jgi:hypothetical protein